MRNLIISPIGDRSVHHTWLRGPGKPKFDLFLCYYGDGPDIARGDCQYYERRKGFKWEHLHYIAENHADVLARYDNIWCPDDDIACDTRGVNQMFEIFGQYNLQLAQPAIARGDFSFKALTQRPGNILRYTPYVEVMCPLFTRAAFDKVRDTFLESRSGWGLDWIWPQRFRPFELAIIDKVGVHHTGPLGKGVNYQFLAKLGIDPYREFKETVARHGGIDWSIHHRMLKGRMAMPSVPDPDDDRGVLARLLEAWRWRRMRHKAA